MQKLLRPGAALLALALAAPLAAQSAPRPIRVDDIFRQRDVRDAQRSPDGQWVAYTVTRADSARDASNTDIWMVSWDGRQRVPVATTTEGESSPRWSPDGRYLAFASARQDAKASQVWLLNRLGGEAVKLTDFKGGVSEFVWSPDGKRLALIVKDPEPETPTGKAAPPIVVDRYHFKRDNEGYLADRRSHLYLFDVESRKSELLTPGKYEEDAPAWSPDGRWIAFVSTRAPDPDRVRDSNIFVVEARAGAQPRQLTTFAGPDGSPVWSPDGRSIAYLQGSKPENSAYNLSRLAVVPVAGGAPRLLTEALDRPVASPQWTPDGRSILFLATDDRTRPLMRVNVASGKLDRLITGERVVNGFSQARDGRLAVLAATATTKAEVFAWEGGALRQLSRENDAWLAELRLGTTEGFSARAPDGNVVNGILVKPADFDPARKYPLLLRIHGGPNSQDQYELNFERELFAANGYVVIAVNYRGSNGRGEAYQNAIFADWGNKEVVDLLAAVDHVVGLGFVDPERLGIGGWSYGGILTDYTIATTPRFKAAISGAGSALQLSMYGTDQYIFQYDNELGPPWKNPEVWIKVSYPFFHADRIKTPTLFMVGERDFNVPAAGSEQMYQALRSLNVPTQLVIYPGQYHGITRPSYRVDQMQRYLAWYDRYLKGAAGPSATQ